MEGRDLVISRSTVTGSGRIGIRFRIEQDGNFASPSGRMAMSAMYTLRCQPTGTLTYTVMTGHRAGPLSPHVLTEMTGSVAGHDGAGIKSHSFRRPV